MSGWSPSGSALREQKPLRYDHSDGGAFPFEVAADLSEERVQVRAFVRESRGVPLQRLPRRVPDQGETLQVQGGRVVWHSHVQLVLGILVEARQEEGGQAEGDT